MLISLCKLNLGILWLEPKALPDTSLLLTQVLLKAIHYLLLSNWVGYKTENFDVKCW